MEGRTYEPLFRGGGRETAFSRDGGEIISFPGRPPGIASASFSSPLLQWTESFAQEGKKKKKKSWRPPLRSLNLAGTFFPLLSLSLADFLPPLLPRLFLGCWDVSFEEREKADKGRNLYEIMGGLEKETGGGKAKRPFLPLRFLPGAPRPTDERRLALGEG